ncbi:hypothetical protein [Brevibacillus brevis]|uniref:hypothetical protein n=1 Tax=Brevibacillus brevis TaxID=1393 RepID=UPI00059FE188|nr:hypothetical protein [Brevibacillus brevis]
MKKSIKGTIAAALLLSSLSIGSSAMASSPDTVVSHVTGNKVQDLVDSEKISENVFTPMEVKKLVNNKKVKGTQGSATFDIPSGYGWVKVYVKNEGTTDITVSVTDPSGSQLMYDTIKPGGAFDEISSSAWGTGKHTVGVSTSGDDMAGYIAVKVAQHENELQ